MAEQKVRVRVATDEAERDLSRLERRVRRVNRARDRGDQRAERAATGQPTKKGDKPFIPTTFRQAAVGGFSRKFPGAAKKIAGVAVKAGGIVAAAEAVRFLLPLGAEALKAQINFLVEETVNPLLDKFGFDGVDKEALEEKIDKVYSGLADQISGVMSMIPSALESSSQTLATTRASSVLGQDPNFGQVADRFQFFFGVSHEKRTLRQRLQGVQNNQVAK